MRLLSPLTLITVFITMLQHSSIAQTPHTIWQHCYGGDSTDIINCVKQTADGGYIAAGYTRSSNGDLSGNGGIKGLWVLKLDAAGNIQWEKTYNDTISYASYIEPTFEGGYILTGSHTIKLHHDGSIAWTDNIQGSIIHQEADSGFIVCDNSGMYPHLFKLYSDGSLRWQHLLISSSDIIWLSDIYPSSGGNYIIGGENYDVHPQPCWGKTDDTGGILAPVNYAIVHGEGGPMARTNDGANLFTYSEHSGGFHIVKFTDALITQWTAGPYAGGISGICASAGNSFATWSGSGAFSSSNMRLIKFDSAHNQVWVDSINATQADITKNVLQASNGNYIVCSAIVPSDTVTPGNHGGTDGWIAEIGFDEGIAPHIEATAIKVYPVPASNQLFVDMPYGYSKAIVKLFNAAGNLIAEDHSSSLSRTLNLSNLSAGMYLLQVINNGIDNYKIIHY